MEKKSSKKKVIFEIALLVALIVFVFVMLFSDSSTSPEQIWEAIKTARYQYFAAALGVLILYTVVYSCSLVVIAKGTKAKVKVGDLYLISTSEFFFNGITPAAVGGQPFQVFAFKQVGVDASKSTGMILMNFLCSLIAQLIVSLISLSFYPLILEYASGMIGLFWLGFFVTALGAIVFGALGVSKTFRKVMIKFMNWFCTWKIMKKTKNVDKKFEKYITNAQRAFKDAWTHKGLFIIALLSKVLAYAILYSIPFFILKAINVPYGFEKGQINATMFFEVMCITSFAMITANYIPTPGATGALELAFKNFLLPILIATGSAEASVVAAETATASAGVILWRFVTFYILMLLSFSCYFFFVKKKHIKYDRLKKDEECEDNLDNSLENSNETTEEIEVVEDKSDEKIE